LSIKVLGNIRLVKEKVDANWVYPNCMQFFLHTLQLFAFILLYLLKFLGNINLVKDKIDATLVYPNCMQLLLHTLHLFAFILMQLWFIPIPNCINA
jgi:hypothetical protein